MNKKNELSNILLDIIFSKNLLLFYFATGIIMLSISFFMNHDTVALKRATFFVGAMGVIGGGISLTASSINRKCKAVNEQSNLDELSKDENKLEVLKNTSLARIRLLWCVLLISFILSGIRIFSQSTFVNSLVYQIINLIFVILPFIFIIREILKRKD